MMDRLYGRLMSLVAIGRVAASTALGGRGARRLQLRMDEAEIRDDTPLIQHYGLASRPKTGADVVVVFPGGNRAAGIAIASNDRRYQVELAAGEVALHDDLGRSVRLTRDGIVIHGGGQPVTITGTPKLRVESLLEVTGDVTIGGRSFNAHTHPETGVVTGAPT